MKRLDKRFTRRRRRKPHLGQRDLQSRVNRLRTPHPTGSLPAMQSVRPRRRSAAFDDQRGSRIGLRLKFGALTVIALFGLLVGRLYTLQIVNGPKLNAAARSTALKDIEVPAARGEILTRNGAVLAGNKSEWVVTISQQAVTNNPGVVTRLAALLPGVTETSIKDALKSNQYASYEPIPIATNVAASTVLYIQENPSLFPGVTAEQEYVRTYPYDTMAAQVLGYVGDINAQQLQQLQGKGYSAQSQIGLTGLEQEYESDLHGSPGIQQVEVDPSGNAVSTVSKTPAQPGDNVVLNMDLGLEQEVSSALATQINTLRGSVPADFGAAVVLDAQTGAVLAMSSYPGYDNNEWIPYISNNAYNSLVHEYGLPLNNYAVAEPQHPGSDFKLATATAALDSGLITGNYYYDDTGTYTEGTPPNQTTLTDAPGDTDLGEMNVATAITESSDIFFYNLGALFCPQGTTCQTTIQKYAAEYGFGESTGIDLPNVSPGQVDGPALRKQLHELDPALYPTDTYYLGDNVETAFGQGETLVTPLQVADAYEAFANGGTRYAPEMAAAIVTSSGKVTRIKPKVLAHVSLPESTYQPMLTGFNGAVQAANGTAYSNFLGFNFTSWNVAGKTGTATANNISQPVSWFVAFGGPKNQKPKYVVCIEIDQGGYGAAASAPVARDIFNYLYSHGIAKLHLGK